MIFPPLCCVDLPTVDRRRCTSASAALSWLVSRSIIFTGLPRLDHYDEISYKQFSEGW
jgi:hypothetical protein